MSDMIVYIKCGLLLKVINYNFLQPFLLEEYKSKVLFIPLAMVNYCNCQYFPCPKKCLQYSLNHYNVPVQ